MWLTSEEEFQLFCLFRTPLLTSSFHRPCAFLPPLVLALFFHWIVSGFSANASTCPRSLSFYFVLDATSGVETRVVALWVDDDFGSKPSTSLPYSVMAAVASRYQSISELTRPSLPDQQWRIRRPYHGTAIKYEILTSNFTSRSKTTKAFCWCVIS